MTILGEDGPVLWHARAMSWWTLLIATIAIAGAGCGSSAGAPTGNPGSPPAGPQARATTRGMPMCTASTLAGYQPSVGRIKSRQLGLDTTLVVSRTVRAEEVACGATPIIPCLDHTRARADTLAAAARPPLVAKVSPGLNELGSDVVLIIDGVKARRVFPTQAALVAHLRALQSAGRSVTIESESRAIEHDFSRVDVVYREREASSQRVAAADFVWEVPLAPRALWEAVRVLDDELRRAGMELTSPSRDRLHAIFMDRLKPEGFDLDELRRSDSMGFLMLALGFMFTIPDPAAPPSGETSADLVLSVHCRM